MALEGVEKKTISQRIGAVFRRGDTENLSSWQLMAFASPAIPQVAIGLPMALFLPPFYTGEMGISLTAWGMIILVARIWDAATDPIAGVICDRYPSRWGQRRHWIVMSIPILMLSCVLLFMPQYFFGEVTFISVLAVMCVMQVGTTIYGLNGTAWGAELSDDYHERSRIMGWRQIVGAVAPLIAFSIPMWVELTGESATNGDKLFWLAIFVLVTMPFFVGLALFSVGERKIVHTAEKDIDIWTSVKILISNKLMVRLVAIDILNAIPMSIMGSTLFFYVQFVLETPQYMSVVMIAIFATTILAVPVWMRATRGVEKHKAMAFATVIGGLLQVLYFFYGAGDIILFAITAMFVNAFLSGPSFLLRSMTADVIDSDTVQTGRQRTGTFFALLEMSTKFAPTIAITMVFPYLDFMGFDPTGQANTPETILALKYVFVIFAPLPMFLAAYLLYNFPLGSKQQEELRRRIDAARTTAGEELE